jgi:phosphatidylglycerophosphatase A
MKRWIVTMGGSGDLPASGTFASLLTCLLLWPIFTGGFGAVVQNSVAIGGTLLFSALSVMLGPWAIKEFGSEDPGKFVLDEGAGICLTALFLPVVSGWRAAGLLLLAIFIAFRVFDITKPPPARQLENLPAGWGILMDDLAAAVYANIVCQLFFHWIAPGLLA